MGCRGLFRGLCRQLLSCTRRCPLLSWDFEISQGSRADRCYAAIMGLRGLCRQLLLFYWHSSYWVCPLVGAEVTKKLGGGSSVCAQVRRRCICTLRS